VKDLQSGHKPPTESWFSHSSQVPAAASFSVVGETSMRGILIQLVTLAIGVPAAFLVLSSRPKTQVFACWLGIAGQISWTLLFVCNKQWLMLVTVVAYSAVWVCNLVRLHHKYQRSTDEQQQEADEEGVPPRHWKAD
jgi:hypothetical protein